ncbi:hypothetical protein [Limnospira platensis]|uniref:hypothetical protein n=2 Tax=Limnospira platensis TaxID=118562 RepID=UPI00049F6022|nr:hypothetical protein APPUASWS_031645 [Arthrospira platensis str. Paraca]
MLIVHPVGAGSAVNHHSQGGFGKPALTHREIIVGAGSAVNHHSQRGFGKPALTHREINRLL